MQTGLSVESRADMLVLRMVLHFSLLAHLSLSAPQVAGSLKVDSAAARPLPELANPFGSSEDNRKLLHSYIQAQVKEGHKSSQLNTWEQDVFSLFSLHDYDRSGLLDGLEMMKLLSDFNTHNASATKMAVADSVESMVDFLLQTKDPNQDGLLAPSELLSPPKAKTKEKPSEAKGQEQAPGEGERQKAGEPKGQEQAPGEGEGQKAGEAKEEGKEKETHAGEQGQQNQHAVEKQVKQEELQKKEQEKPHAPEAPAAEQEHKQPAAPVHQGQPEM